MHEAYSFAPQISFLLVGTKCRFGRREMQANSSDVVVARPS
jgi:hypothetical protein